MATTLSAMAANANPQGIVLLDAPTAERSKPLSSFAKADEQVALKLAEGLNIQTISTFAAAEQHAAAALTKKVLETVTKSQLGEVGQIIDTMSNQARELDLKMLDGYQPAWWKKIPLFKRWLDKVEVFIAEYESLETKLRKSGTLLDRASLGIKVDNQRIKALDKLNLDMLNNISNHIRALEIKIAQMRQELEEARVKYDPNDLTAVHALQNLERQIHLYDMRLGQLKETAALSFADIPTFLDMVYNNESLELIINYLNTTGMMLFRNNVFKVIHALRTREYAAIAQSTKAFMRDMALKSSELTKTAAIEAAKASEEPVFGSAVITKIYDNFIDQLKTTNDIRLKGEQSRAQMAVDIMENMQRLQKVMVEVSGTNSKDYDKMFEQKYTAALASTSS